MPIRLCTRRLWWLSLAAAALLMAVVAAVWRWWLATDTARLLERAYRAMEQERLAEAAELLDRVLARRPADAAALLARGRLAGAEGQWSAALELLGGVGDGVPQSAEARYYEGKVLLELGQARAAEDAWLRALQLAPDSAGPLEQLADLYACQLRVNELRTVLEGLHRVRPWRLKEFVWYVTGGESWGFAPDRIARLQRFVAADAADAASRAVLARMYVRIHQADQALSVLGGMASTSMPVPLCALRAEAFLELGRAEQAAAQLAHCRRHGRMLEQPRAGTAATGSVHPLLALCQGRCQQAAGRGEQAVAWLRQAVALDPNSRSANYQLGKALQQTGHSGEADRFLLRAQKLETLVNRAMQLLMIGPGPARTVGLMEVGRRLAELDRPVEAALTFEQVLLAEPGNRVAQDEYRRLLSQLGGQGRGVGRRVGTRSVRFELPALAKQAAGGRHPVGPAGHLRFDDVHLQAGVDFQYFTGQSGLRYMIESIGGGVAAFDYDGDSWPDLFFTQGCRIPVDAGRRDYTNCLYRNLAGSRFIDVSGFTGLDDAHYGLGCTAGDYDNDGDLDLVVANFGRNLLFRNNGDGTFSDVTGPVGLRGRRMSSSMALADFDRDGDLDLYIVNYVAGLKVCRDRFGRPVSCLPPDVDAEQDILYENRGDGTFRDVTNSAGIVASDGKGLGVLAANLDDDRWPDIYVANDTTPNFLFRNVSGEQAGRVGPGMRFAEMGLPSGAAVNDRGECEAGMGIACADFDADGLLDLYVTNFQGETNTLYLNEGGLRFVDATRRVPALAASSIAVLGFGTQAIDADLDGRPDLFVTNGHVDSNSALKSPEQMRPQLFWNRGNGQFEDVSLVAGFFFARKYVGRGVARLDWNRDGRPDLVVSHQHAPAALLRNETPAVGHYIALRLIGKRSNRDGFNARLRIDAGGRRQVHELTAGSGYMAFNEPALIVGLGRADGVQRLEIDWPSGRREWWSDLAADRHYVLIEGSGTGPHGPRPSRR